MGILSMLANNKMINRQAKLLVDIELDNGEERKAGDIVHVLFDKGNNKYHVEHNDFACTVSGDEIEFIKR